MRIEMKNKPLVLSCIGTLLCFSLLIGISYSFYKADIGYTDKTESKIQTSKIGLAYTGTGELLVENMIPGDSFVKTFNIENTTNVGTKYNIYMENITNEFADDLVYKITDDSGNVVVEQQPLPETNNGKVYLKRDININVSPANHRYIITIDYLYKPNESQDNYQGKVFMASIGIDS